MLSIISANDSRNHDLYRYCQYPFWQMPFPFQNFLYYIEKAARCQENYPLLLFLSGIPAANLVKRTQMRYNESGVNKQICFFIPPNLRTAYFKTNRLPRILTQSRRRPRPSQSAGASFAAHLRLHRRRVNLSAWFHPSEDSPPRPSQPGRERA